MVEGLDDNAYDPPVNSACVYVSWRLLRRPVPVGICKYQFDLIAFYSA